MLHILFFMSISCSLLVACFLFSISCKSHRRQVTLETGGSRLSQREEDITHDSGATHTRCGDNVEDAVDIMTEVFLKREKAGQICQITKTLTNKHTHIRFLTLFVSRFSDSLSLTGSISQGLCSVQIYEDA